MATVQDRPNSPDPLDWVAIPVGIVILLVILWLMKGESLYYGAGKMAYYMLWPFQFISGVQEFRLSITSDIVRPPSPEKVFLWTSAAWYVPSAILGIVCARLAWNAHKHPIKKMKGKLSVDALMRFQAQVHSPIAPIVPIAKDLHKNLDPRFHEAYHPHEVVEKYELALPDGTLDREKAENYFLSQLGSRVYRPALDDPNMIFADRLNDYEKTIFAMLAPLAIKVKEGLGDYQKLCDALNYSAVNATQTPNLTLANELYLEYRANPKLNNLFKTHHFSVTYLMQLYMLAKRAGKISTAHWVGWLRPNANALYAALNTAGRKTPFTESAGAYAQWMFELECQKKKRMPIQPCVIGAVDALKEEWEFWKTADQRVTEETLWGKMHTDQSQLDQDLFRRYVTDILAPRMSSPPSAGNDLPFDVQESAARKQREDAEIASLMAGIKQEFPTQQIPEQ